MQHLAKDLKHALRLFRESPGFTATIIAALTLGIGVNTAIFSVVNAVLLKPIPFPEPDRIVELWNTRKGTPAGPVASPAKFAYWRTQTDVFEAAAAFRTNAMNYDGGDTPQQVSAGQVSQGYFSIFGARFLRGRPFTAAEDSPHGPKVAVVSYDFWQHRLSGDPHILGKTLSLSGDSYTVVGVVEPGFNARDLGGKPDLWVPFQLQPNSNNQGNYFRVAAKLKPGVTLAQAKARIAASAAAFKQRFPKSIGKQGGFTVLSLQRSLVGPQVRTELWVLLGAVGFVLLIACANAANLLLARATARRHEIAIRSALGAGRGRILRQLLTESVLLSLISGVLGLVVGFIGMRALLAVSTAGLPRLGRAGSLLGLDWHIVAFTLVLSLATGIVFGLVPALAGSRTDLNTIIKDTSSRTGGSLRRNKARSALVMGEVGLAVVLLVGAALLIRTSLALGRVDPGFDPSHVVTMRTSLSGNRFQSSQAVARISRLGLRRVRAMPGVESATATCCVPLQGGYSLPFDIIGRANGKGPFTGGAGFVITSSGYFASFGIPVLRGRAFTDHDDAGAAPVVIINEALAKKYWSRGRDPLHDRILIGGRIMPQLRKEPIRRIIGIVGSVRSQMGRDPFPTVYVPQAQVPDALNALNMSIAPLAWVVRTRTDSAALWTAVRNRIRSATGLPVMGLRSMQDVVSLSVSRQRFNMLLMSIFGAAALLLAAIGIYGLMAYSVEQRAQEIGIRMSLGAESSRVRRMVVSQAMKLVLIGVGAGLVAAFFTANVLGSFLFEVEPHDVLVFVAVPLALIAISIVSVWLPAERASRVDPLEALRYE